MLEDSHGEVSVGRTQLDAEKLETLRGWGEGLREVGSEELAAAGRAILLLLDEIDRLHIEQWHQRQSPSADPEETSGDDEPLSTTLRDRLRWRLGRANDPLSASLPQPVENNGAAAPRTVPSAPADRLQAPERQFEQARPPGCLPGTLTAILPARVPGMTGFERPRYFAGKLLTAEDLELGQRYQIEKRWLLNRMLQGVGIVSGLDVVAGPQGTVNVAPGFALDPHGREMLVGEPQQLAIPNCSEPVSICLLYTEMETDHGTICETFELKASTAPAPDEAVVLGVVENGVNRRRGLA
jgi:hypothetical protein